MTDYVNKKQMSSFLENAGVKTQLEWMGFPNLNNIDTRNHRFYEVKIEQVNTDEGALPKITGGYEYREADITKKYFFTIFKDEMEAREIQCW